MAEASESIEARGERGPGPDDVSKRSGIAIMEPSTGLSAAGNGGLFPLGSRAQ
jgi:hypothetical protein